MLQPRDCPYRLQGEKKEDGGQRVENFLLAFKDFSDLSLFVISNIYLAMNVFNLISVNDIE